MLAVAGASILVVTNQHRFQPWLYQLSIFAAIFAVPGTDLQRSLLRALVASIYLYSAVSKLDFEFLHTVGPEFVDTAANLLGLPDRLTPRLRNSFAWLIPVSELLIGLGICLNRWRRPAGILACVMHVGLLVLLSPWGLDHSWGVLLWNVHFLGVALMLLVLRPEPRQRTLPNTRKNRTLRAKRGLLGRPGYP